MFSNKLRHSGKAKKNFGKPYAPFPFSHFHKHNTSMSRSPQALFPSHSMRYVTRVRIKKKSGTTAAFLSHIHTVAYT